MEFMYIDKDGFFKMVDVMLKELSFRVVRVSGKIFVGKDVIEVIENGFLLKGDVFVIVKIAVINAVKKIFELIFFCYNIFLFFVDVLYKINREEGYIEVVLEVKIEVKIGVEMEVIIVVVIFLEIVYDMCKVVKKDMVIIDIRFIEKFGGKFGYYIFESENKIVKVVLINISR